MAAPGGPRVTVVVPTRDRPDALQRCIRSILASKHDAFEVVVVDQSARPDHVQSDERLRVVHSHTSGKSAALNVGVSTARGSVVAFTDDDCTVPVDWLARAESLLDRHPGVEMVFGEIVAADHDPSEVFVPVTHWKRFRIVRGKASAYVRGGGGANLIARRRLFELIGEWDEAIGPGSRFKACEEWDVYYRALASGAAVALAPELVTIHHRGRAYVDGSARMLVWSYAYGEGAVIGKHLRLRDIGMLPLAARIVLQDALHIVRRLSHGRRPPLLGYAWKYRGIFEGANHQVDPDRRVFSSA